MYVNGYQFLGNNECPDELINELKRQGCDMNADDCFKNFEIKELQPIIEALEKYIIDMNAYFMNREYDPRSIADFTEEFNKGTQGGNGLTWKIGNLLECGYLFVTINFLNAIKDDYVEDCSTERVTYKIKEGHHVYISGY